MDNTVYSKPETSKKTILRFFLIIFGFAFLIIGLGVTVGFVYGGYTIVTHPDPFTTLFAYIDSKDDVFIKWIINDHADEIVFSRILMIVFLAIAASIIVSVILKFISMCVSSGKALLSISRNFDD